MQAASSLAASRGAEVRVGGDDHEALGDRVVGDHRALLVGEPYGGARVHWRSAQDHAPPDLPPVCRTGRILAPAVALRLLAVAPGNRTEGDGAMKIGGSFVTLASAAVLTLVASAAQARIGEGQATTAQTQAAKKDAPRSYHAEVKRFEKQKRYQAAHRHPPSSFPSLGNDVHPPVEGLLVVGAADVTGYAALGLPDGSPPSGPVTVAISGARVARLVRIVNSLPFEQMRLPCMENILVYRIVFRLSSNSPAEFTVTGFGCGHLVRVSGHGTFVNREDPACTLLREVRTILPASATGTQDRTAVPCKP